MSHKLILASNSPRRQQLMKEAGFRFEVRVLEVEEDFPQDMPVAEVAEYLARKKGQAHQHQMSNDEIVITADTTVIIHEQVLNKPTDEAEAHQMLQMLSGQAHQVITGVCVSLHNRQESFSDVTKVSFKKLEQSEIEYYVSHYRPFDKAGAYAIQEWIGMVGIERIEGSYFNVVGLPLEKLYRHLRNLAVTTVFPF